MEASSGPSGSLLWVMEAGFCVGGFAFAIAMGTIFAALDSARDRRAWRRARRLDCGQLYRLRSLPRWCYVTGTIVPGPSGTVRALMSGRQAVWYRTVVQRYYRQYGGADGDSTNAIETIWQREGGEPFGLTDGTGTVLVSGNLLGVAGGPSGLKGKRLDGAEPVTTVFEEAAGSVRAPGPSLQWLIDCGEIDVKFGYWSNTNSVAVSEYAVEAGTAVSVLGTPRAAGNGAIVMSQPRWGTAFKVTTESPAEVIRAMSRDLRKSAKIVVVLLLVAVFGGVAVALATGSR